MQRYRITTPVPDWEGKVGTVTFVHGAAEVEAEADAAAMYYFWSQGYGIEPLDGDPAYEYRHPHLKTGEDRIAELEAELARLKGGTPPPAPVPADGAEMPKKSASTEAWRAWAVAHRGLAQDEADTLSRDDLIARYTQEG